MRESALEPSQGNITMNFDESILGNNEKFTQALAQLNEEERKSIASSFRK